MSPSELLLGRRLKSALDLMKPNLQHQVEKEQERQKIEHDWRAVNHHLILEKKFMQEIMVKERSGYQPRYLKKNLVHNCSLWNYCKIRW